jgi:hypothetical protein
MMVDEEETRARGELERRGSAVLWQSRKGRALFREHAILIKGRIFRFPCESARLALVTTGK